MAVKKAVAGNTVQWGAAAPKSGGKIKKAAAGTEKPRALTIDYPREGELIWSGHYAVRISAAAGAVEASVDGKPWVTCRNQAGHWWLDMSGLPDGEHALAARPAGGGREEIRKFKVSRA